MASLVVVLYHFSLTMPGVNSWIMGLYPLRIVVAGQSAVYVFFVLSGFVLFLAFDGSDRRLYLPFAARRIVRLYPPVAAAILFSAALYILVDPAPIPALAGWFTLYSWTDYPSASLILGHLLLLDTDRYHALDNPIWSLVVEFRLSLVFPLIAAGVRQRPMLTLLVALLVSLACHAALVGHAIRPFDLVFTGQYLGLFAIGACLAARFDDASQTSAPRHLLAPLLVAIALLSVTGPFAWFALYAGAALLVAVCAAPPRAAGGAALGFLYWLGSRSFSLYLVHVPLILAAVHLGFSQLPLPIVLGIAFALCFVVAELFWRGVERPSIRLSRAVGDRLAATLPGTRAR